MASELPSPYKSLNRAPSAFPGKTRIRLALIFAATIAGFSLPAQESKNATELYKDAITADQNGETAKAIALYQKVLTLRPGSLEARSNLGADLASTGRYNEAIAEYQRALKIDPRNSVVRLNLALAHYKLGEYQKAADTFSVLQKEDPANKQILYLALVHLKILFL